MSGDTAAGTRAVGIDVGADAAWLVALETEGLLPRISGAMLSHPIDIDQVVDFCRDSAVAIDAPAAPSVGAHLLDSRIAPKFRPGRCSEVALARAGISVQFVTPQPGGSPFPSWMRAGFEIWRALEGPALEPVETYPHGVFWRLAGHPLFYKKHPSGARQRLAVLAAHLELSSDVAMWSHDGIDALACALVASLLLRGGAERIGCTDDQQWAVHDGSAMYLPRRSLATST